MSSLYLAIISLSSRQPYLLWIIFIILTLVLSGIMEIEIKAIAYSPIAYPLDTSNQWQNLMSGSEADNLDLFKSYIQEVVIKGDISDVTVGKFDNTM